MADAQVTCINKQPRNALLLDPFCGTGVVLQEALLMGYDVYGTDLEPRMIDYSGANLDWLSERFDLSGREMRLEAGEIGRRIGLAHECAGAAGGFRVS